MAFGRVLIPVNGSRTDEDAIALACSLIKKGKEGKIFVLYVIEVQRRLPLDADLPEQNERGENVLHAAEQFAKKYDHTIETDLLQAREVGPAIVDEAVERGADLIIMGIQFKRKFGEFTVGQTVPYVLKNAPCKVWVCREAIPPMEGGR